jgi:TonB family protein
MYFEIEDYRPDITPVGRAISWREGVLLSIIFHLCVVILLLLFPRLFHDDSAARARALLAQQAQAQRDQARFVFVAPLNDVTARKPRPRAEPSDKDRVAAAPVPPKPPTNPLPYSRGNTPERVQAPPPPQPTRGQGPAPEPAQGEQAQAQPEVKVPDTPSQMAFNTPREQPQNNGAGGRSAVSGGQLGDALRNLQRYVPRDQFDNPGGSGGVDAGGLQFDTKGVEFGPWIRRFIAQVKRNWIIPNAAMFNKGHVVITFNVHKDGRLTDITVVGPCPIDPFNTAAFGALSSSNPTVPLPPEYPDERTVMTITFFYNETPP